LTQTKQRLGQQVAARIPSGSTLFLDAGSTLLAVAAQLKGPLTVITASLDIAKMFSDRAGIPVRKLGGGRESENRLVDRRARQARGTRYRADH
ncbi:hypothetical protein K4G89_22060, partial [Mycobacterium tuberculosis]|nr:hypothetical protein [Mycobacterium tuberculosis]